MKPSIIAFLVMTTSLTSMAYYLLLAARFYEVSGLGLLSQSVSLACFLIGLAVGGIFHKKLNNEEQSINLRLLTESELFVSLVTPLALLVTSLTTSFFLAKGNFFVQNSFKLNSFFIFSIYLPFFLFLGLFSGIQLPLFFKSKNLNLNNTLFLNYTGALIAGPLVNHFLDLQIPEGKQFLIVFVFNFLNLVILNFSLKKTDLLIKSSMLIGLILIFTFFYPLVKKSELSINYFGHNISSLKDIPNLIEVIENYGKVEEYISPYQKIHIVTEPPLSGDPEEAEITLYLNRKPQFSLYDHRTYHESMIEGAVNLNKEVPQNILILGAGDGILASMLAKKSGIKKITQIELDPLVLSLAKKHEALSLLNNNFFYKNYSYYNLLIDDAVSYLRKNTYKYDAIFIDFPFPFSSELFNLYSYEFYALVKNSLTMKGFFILDFPTFKEKSPRYKISHKILNSIKKSGMKNIFIFGPKASFAFVNNKKEFPVFNYSNMPESLSWSTLFNLAPINHFYSGEYTDEYYSLFYSH